MQLIQKSGLSKMRVLTILFCGTLELMMHRFSAQIHFRPMVSWIENKRGELVVDAIFRLDEMEYLVNRFLPKILGCKLKYEGYKPSNVSKKKSEGDIPITPSALELLELTYSEDIKLWNQVANRK